MADTKQDAGPLTPKRAFRPGHIAVGIRLKCGGYGDTARIDATADLTTAQARALAQALHDMADEADAKVAAKAAKEDRRKRWRDSEVAAGRMRIISLGRLT